MAGMLDNYVPVSERLAAAAADGLEAVTTQEPVILDGAMGYIRAVVKMADGRTASGTATFRLDLTGKSAQATNPIEDAETSAVGRALAFLGYEVKRGVASREEVREAQRRSAPARYERTSESRETAIDALRLAYREAKEAGAQVQPPTPAQVEAWSEDEIKAQIATYRAMTSRVTRAA